MARAPRRSSGWITPGQTRLIQFGSEAAENRKQRGEASRKCSTSRFYPHCGRTGRRAGSSSSGRRSASDSRQAREPKEELRLRLHQPVAESGSGCSRSYRLLRLSRSSREQDSLNSFPAQVIWRWTALRRRSQRDQMTRERSGRWSIDGFRARRSCIRSRTCASTPFIQVGAVCRNSARTDLCGGRRETGVPYRDKSKSPEL